MFVCIDQWKTLWWWTMSGRKGQKRSCLLSDTVSFWNEILFKLNVMNYLCKIYMVRSGCTMLTTWSVPSNMNTPKRFTTALGWWTVTRLHTKLAVETIRASSGAVQAHCTGLAGYCRKRNIWSMVYLCNVQTQVLAFPYM